MNNVVDVFPRDNLGPAAQQWKRAIEDISRSNAYRISNLKLSAQGDNRAAAGQLGVLGRSIDTLATQVAELGSRNSGVHAPTDLVRTSSSSSWLSSTRNFTFSGEPGGTRTTIISFTSGYTFASAASTTCFVEVRGGGTLLFTARFANGVPSPSGWTDQIGGSFVYPIASGGTAFSVVLYVQNMQPSTAQTVTLTNMTFDYVRADKV